VLVMGVGMQGRIAAQEKGKTHVGSVSSTVAGGRRIFRPHCAACHGLDGRGGEHAPSIVQDQVKSMSDDDLKGIIRSGIPGKGMPEFSSLGAVAINAVVAALREMQGATAAEVVTGDAARGRSLFFGRAGCSACHVMQGTGNFVADDLSDYGRHHQPSEIRDAISKPEKLVDSRVEQAAVTTRSGGEFSVSCEMKITFRSSFRMCGAGST